MSFIKAFFDSFSARREAPKPEEPEPTLLEYFEDARQIIRQAIESLSAEFWDRVEDLEGCTQCGAPKEKGKGWIYREIDYKFSDKEGKLEVVENDRELLCEKCA